MLADHLERAVRVRDGDVHAPVPHRVRRQPGPRVAQARGRAVERVVRRVAGAVVGRVLGVGRGLRVLRGAVVPQRGGLPAGHGAVELGGLVEAGRHELEPHGGAGGERQVMAGQGAGLPEAHHLVARALGHGHHTEVADGHGVHEHGAAVLPHGGEGGVHVLCAQVHGPRGGRGVLAGHLRELVGVHGAAHGGAVLGDHAVVAELLAGVGEGPAEEGLVEGLLAGEVGGGVVDPGGGAGGGGRGSEEGLAHAAQRRARPGPRHEVSGASPGPRTGAELWGAARTHRAPPAHTSVEVAVSRLPVGSSPNTTPGRVSRARATATRCC